MTNDIIKLLNIEYDDNLIITAIDIIGTTKYIHVSKKLIPLFCPICSHRMHSKGIYKRTINHPILQDGYKLVFLVSQRRWICSNPKCNCVLNDEFTFLQRYDYFSCTAPPVRSLSTTIKI